MKYPAEHVHERMSAETNQLKVKILVSRPANIVRLLSFHREERTAMSIANSICERVRCLHVSPTHKRRTIRASDWFSCRGRIPNPSDVDRFFLFCWLVYVYRFLALNDDLILCFSIFFSILVQPWWETLSYSSLSPRSIVLSFRCSSRCASTSSASYPFAPIVSNVSIFIPTNHGS